jgi:hypothetical protein
MRNVLALLAAVIFVLYSSVLAAAPAKACCKDAHCPVAQCVAMACAPSAMPVAMGKALQFDLPALRETPAVHRAPTLPCPAEEIWRPPD